MQEDHGGNIYRYAESCGFREEEVIDFSASINPLGVPESARSAIMGSMGRLFNYPDPDAKELRLKIASHTGVSPDSIVCGNGSTELIYLVAMALAPRKVLIPAPTFTEYQRACGISGAAGIINYRMDKERSYDVVPEDFVRSAAGDNELSSPCDMAFLCNPNNPTGRLIGRDDMREIADGARKAGCTLVVDEAFIDFCPEASIIDEVKNNPYLVVLRSLTKFYALSGLRIGYAVLPPTILEAVKKAREPWTVNTLAQKAGVAVLGDSAYKTATFEIMAREKAAMEEGFRRLGVSWLPSAANFYLLHLKNGQEVAANLRKQGILVRDCSNFIGLDRTYVRVAVKSGEDNMRLLKEISSCTA
jgi:threonine-phosphate decarboxylase